MAGRIFFGVACVLSAFSLYLSYLILRHRPRLKALSYLGYSYVFFALWLVWSFVHLVPEEPSAHFITLQYQLCFVLFPPGLALLLLFALAYLAGADASRAAKIVAGTTCVASILMVFFGTVIHRAEFTGNHFLVEYGSLYPLFMAAMGILTASFFWALAAKAVRSSGTERMRVLYIILGYAVFLFAVGILSVLLPLLAGRDVASDYAYPLMVFPLSTTAYALLKHRILDIRLAAQKAFSYAVVVLLFGAPLVSLFATFGYRFRETPSVLAAMTVAMVAFSSMFIPTLLKIADNLAPRVVFGSLYRKEKLVKAALSWTLGGSGRDGIILPTLELMRQKMGLSDIAAVVPSSPTHPGEAAGIVLYSARQGKSVPGSPGIGEALLALAESTTAINLSPGPWEEASTGPWRALASLGFRASFPLKGMRTVQGALLAGSKENGSDLDPYDLDTLEECASRLGTVLENLCQSERLTAHLEELEKTGEALQRSERLTGQVITLTQRELREPVERLIYHVRKYLDSPTAGLPMEILEMMDDAARRLEKVMEKFSLAFTLKSGGYTPRWERTRIDELVEDLIVGFVPSERDRIKLDRAPGIKVAITDPYLLRTVLAELVENALYHSGKGKPVTVRIRGMEGHTVLEVEDSGDGIPEDFLRRIFTPFARAEDLDKHRKGLGLGLYIVRLATEICGIGVEVETTPGKGSLFRLLLGEESDGTRS